VNARKEKGGGSRKEKRRVGIAVKSEGVGKRKRKKENQFPEVRGGGGKKFQTDQGSQEGKKETVTSVCQQMKPEGCEKGKKTPKAMTGRKGGVAGFRGGGGGTFESKKVTTFGRTIKGERKKGGGGKR